MSFADLGVSRPVVDALEARGFTTPFAVQQLVVADVLSGADVLAQSPTGSGKTLAFGVPMADLIEATDQRPSALVLAPTRELAGQIVEEMRGILHSRALSVAVVHGGVGFDQQIKRARKAHVVVATPGRLEDLLGRGDLSLRNVKILVLDEADRMLDMGFKPAVDRIVGQVPPSRQTLFFSATLEGEAGRVAAAYTTNPRRHVHAQSEERRGDVVHRFVHLAHEAKLDALVSELRHEERGRTLVFVRTKRGADRLVKRLGTEGVASVAMHGDKSQSQRQRALARFESGEADTLVATDVAARGIDVPHITHVIQFDAPEDRDTYVHRVGRTARAGRSGTGVSFVIPDQTYDVGKIARDLGLEAQFGRPVTGSNGNGDRPRPQGRGSGGGGNGRGRSGGRPNGGNGRGRSESSGSGRSGGGRSFAGASASPSGRSGGRGRRGSR